MANIPAQAGKRDGKKTLSVVVGKGTAWVGRPGYR